jgi:MarR family transcriptional regulator, organic hydroperoxide resistance regulator
MKDDSPHGLLRALELAGHAVDQHLSRRLAQIDLTEAEGHVIFHLVEIGPQKLAGIPDLNRAFGMRPSTLTSVLDRLENRRMITRKPNPGDRRSFLIGVTRSGRLAAGRVTAIFEELERSATSSVSARDMTGFHKVLTALRDSCD